MGLRGRRVEREAVEQLLVAARDGRSGVLLIRGEAGIGKTALLDHVRAAASGFRVLDTVGIESEAEFTFAGLHRLCAPLLDRAEALPEPQKAAIGVAFGLLDGAAPDRFLVGLAVLNLLAETAEDGPLLCLVDDAQWLDQVSAQLLAFVARRVSAERMALVFARRDPGSAGSDVDPFAGLPELRLTGLGDTDARALLSAAVHAPVDEVVRDRVLAEARGNPLALLELPSSVPAARSAGGFEVPDAATVPDRVEDGYRRRSGSLPTGTQLLLLIAAAEPTGEAALLWRAARLVGIEPEAAAPAEAAGLIEIDTWVRFRHPLVRSAVYRAAAPADRRRAHRVLATATDPRSDPDRRALHRARATAGVDEDVAAELERSAGRARGRGGPAAAAAFLQHAAELSADPADRAHRALAAAHARYEAGTAETALELSAVAAAGPLDALGRARLDLLRARIAFHTTRGSDVPGMLMDAATALGPLDAALARETHLQAIEASFHAGHLGRGRGVLEVVEAARDAPAPTTPPRPVDLLLDGLITRFTRGYEAGVSTLQRALAAVRADDRADGETRRRLWLACHVAAMLWDDEAIHELADRDVRLAREAGALAGLPSALNALSSTLVLTGELVRAAELMAEEQAVAQLTGAPRLPNARLTLASWRGREAETSRLYAAVVEDATRRGEGSAVGMARVSLAYLHNGLGNHDAALAAAEACEHDEWAYGSVALPELIEAAVRAGRPERAVAALAQLTSRAHASGTRWALGLAARSRALTSTGPAADEHYREAIEHLSHCRMATHLARAHLVYGEWLRRADRRRDAGAHLHTAHDMLSGMGVEAFAERAARELRAIGEHPRTRTARPTDSLTAQELHIARLVAAGSTNREVGAQLFLSPRTVEARLRSVFHKLGITSRRQLLDVRLP